LGGGAQWGNPYMEWLLTGDVEKYGPSGTNAFAFNLYEGVPEQYFGGELASSWEIQAGPPITFIWHLRHNIMFTGNTAIGMAPRELTAKDVVFSENRAVARPGFAGAFAWWGTCSVVDNYTVKWVTSGYNTNWSWRMGGTALGQIWASEVVTAGPDNWRYACGTGPFILESYVQGAGATYTRNPNYWGTTTINGKSYQEPFIQKLIYPIIPDISTEIAAVRTGKLDWAPKIPITYQQNLASSNTKLIATKYLSGTIDILKFNRLTSAVANNVKVRQALMIGTDFKTIASIEYGDGVYYSFPFAPGADGYIPMNQLPANIQQLWTYTPSLAKQMIKDAGYPNGLSIQIDVGPSQTEQDVSSILVGEWAQIGVTATIKVLDAVASSTEYNNVTYKDSIWTGFTVVNPYTVLQLGRAGLAGAIYLLSDPLGIDAEIQAIQANPDPAVRSAGIKKVNLEWQPDCGYLGFANPYVLNCYEPWMRNYFGEIDASYYNQIPMIKRMWLDPTLK
jgi:peptide/nickel transport system substrate-binding protein